MNTLMLPMKDVQGILLREYGIACSDIRQLNGYVDKNFWIKDEANGNEYVLRAIRDDNFYGEEAAKDIDKIFEHLVENGFQICHVIKTKNGSKRYVHELGNNRRWYIRLSYYIPGKSIVESQLTGKQLIEVAANVGQLCALFHKCVQNNPFSDKKLANFGREDDYIWFPVNFLHLKKFINYTQNERIKEIVEKVLENFENKIIPLFPNLKKGIVHGDFSNSNLILLSNIKESDSTPVKKKLGIIDFEDCHTGPFVFDLCTCMAYMMTNSIKDNGDNKQIDKLLLAGKTLANYSRFLSLNDSEIAVLYYGVLARLSTSYVMSFSHLTAQDSDQDEYYKLQSSKCPEIIEIMWEKGEEATLDYWMKIAP